MENTRTIRCLSTERILRLPGDDGKKEVVERLLYVFHPVA